jgi:hypothetical protein
LEIGNSVNFEKFVSRENVCEKFYLLPELFRFLNFFFLKVAGQMPKVENSKKYSIVAYISIKILLALSQQKFVLGINICKLSGTIFPKNPYNFK